MKLSVTLTVEGLQERAYQGQRTLEHVVILDDSAPQRGRHCQRIPPPPFLFQCGQKDGVNDCLRNPQPIFLLLCGARVRRKFDFESAGHCAIQ